MDKYEQRRLNLIELAKGCGTGKPADLARALGRSDSYVARMLYPDGKPGKKRIGEDMVELINERFGLKPGDLDHPMDGSIPRPVVAPPPAPPQSSLPRGDLVQPDVLAALGVITDREARIINWFRMSTDTSKTIIETAARRVEKKQLSAVVDDQLQPGAARAGDRNRE